ncbi:MAG: DUF3299 domain-containing protein [Rhizobiaceae bacterium]|nr:DUF3299 domain-containing protein [Rhizobiaceae bacterium]
MAALWVSAAQAAPRSVLWKDLRVGAQGDALGGEIAIRGYVLPIDREGELVYEFMLVPWVGACSHTPPPPGDQILHVRPAQPWRLKEVFEPVTVTGELETEQTLSQLFLVDGVVRIGSDYRIRQASIAAADRVPDARIAPGADKGAAPWKFLRK